jgi:branched-chain amino acid transport system substrate-binding protein
MSVPMMNKPALKRRHLLAAAGGAVAAAAGLARPAIAAMKTFRVGVLGVMSGPDAAWGLHNKYCAIATANMYNAAGGFEIGGEKYGIEVSAMDDQLDPKTAVSGAEKLTQEEGLRYVIGPNVDTTALSIKPVMERNKAIYIPYAFNKTLYTPPAENAILGMIASYEAGPIIYQYLIKTKGIKTIAFLAANEPDALNQQQSGVAAAQKLGLDVVVKDATYQASATDFFPVVSPIVKKKPDLLVFSGVAPATAPLLIKAARELGYQGLLSTETAQDIKILNEGAGKYAEGFISVGGASPPEIRSAYMEQFVKEYAKAAGQWDDEAGTKVYALEMILHTIAKAGPAAIGDTAPYKAAIDSFAMPNPFLKSASTLQYVGTEYFGQKRQIGVPMVVNEVKDGTFQTLFVGSVA